VCFVAVTYGSQLHTEAMVHHIIYNVIAAPACRILESQMRDLLSWYAIH